MDEQVRAEAQVGPYGQIPVYVWCSKWGRASAAWGAGRSPRNLRALQCGVS